MKNYYQILGVGKDASQEEIKRAYRILAKKYHPDANENKEEVKKKFQEITEAYKVLSDPKTREQYHAWGHAAYTKYASRPGSGAYGYGSGSGHEGEDHDGHCGACGGHGGEDHDGHCGACGGHGDGHDEDGHCGACGHHRKKHKKEEPAPGSVRTAVRLTYQEVLFGAVKEVELPAREKRKVKIQLPPRCYSGRFFMLQDVLCEGEQVEQKNIVVIVLLEEQEGFERKDYHLYSTRMVSYMDLVLGGDIEIPTIEGTVVYHVKPGTRNGSCVRLEGKGLWMPPMVGNRGDQYVTLQVEIPTHLTARQEEALRAFGDTMRMKL